MRFNSLEASEAHKLELDTASGIRSSCFVSALIGGVSAEEEEGRGEGEDFRTCWRVSAEEKREAESEYFQHLLEGFRGGEDILEVLL